MDASYILQFVTGLINKFPAEELFINPIFPDVSNARFVIGNAQASPLSNVILPLQINAADGIFSADVTITMDPNLLQFQAIQSLYPGLQLSQQYDAMTGTLRLSLAGLQQLQGDVQLLQLVFETGVVSGLNALAVVHFDVAFGNETDLVAMATDGSVAIEALATSVSALGSTKFNTLQPVYPNPMDGESWMSFVLDKETEVVLEITDLQGRQLVLLKSGKLEAGSHQIQWDGRNAAGNRLASGLYLVRLSAATVQSVQRLLIK
jgi:hypothetical protein